MRIIRYFLLFTASVALLGVGATASAQYFDDERSSDGYLPEARSEPVAQAQQPTDEPAGIPDVRFGFGADFGFGFTDFPSLDRELYAPNDAAELGRSANFAFDANGFVEFVQSVRVGFIGGTRLGGSENVFGQSGHFGFGADFGHAWLSGWSFFAGGGVGAGFFHSESENRADEYYDYSARGLWTRGHLRIERALSGYVTLRLTAAYEHTFVKSDEVEISTPPDAPQPVLGEPEGDYDSVSVMFGIVFTTF